MGQASNDDVDEHPRIRFSISFQYKEKINFTKIIIKGNMKPKLGLFVLVKYKSVKKLRNAFLKVAGIQEI